MNSTSFQEQLRQKILSYKPDFDLQILEIGLQQFQLVSYKAGSFIIKKGDICQRIYIAEQSISRCYFTDENGEEKTLWIEPEMSFLTDFNSFKNGETSTVDICLYQNSLVYFIERDALFQLYKTYHEWSLLGIVFLEELLYDFITFNTQIHFNDATENYRLIESKYLNYLKVVPLKHIASRLNISPVHLSRIRAKQFDK